MSKDNKFNDESFEENYDESVKHFLKRFEEVNIRLYFDTKSECFVAETKEMPLLIGADESPVECLRVFARHYSSFLKSEKRNKIANVSKRRKVK